jgi:hypothetical protein
MQQIIINRNSNPRVAIQSGGLVFCVHKFTLRQFQTDIWYVEDDNVQDLNPADLDPSPQTDQHPLGDVLSGITGRVILRWSIDLFAMVPTGELYDVSVFFIQDHETRLLGHYRHTDEGFGPLTDLRQELGLAILDIA